MVAVITIDALYWPKPVITRDMRAWAVRAINAGRSNKWVAREFGVELGTVGQWVRDSSDRAKRMERI